MEETFIFIETVATLFLTPLRPVNNNPEFYV